MVQPSEGLVVSIPVLVEAQCFERHAGDLLGRLAGCMETAADGAPRLGVLSRVCTEFLDYPPDAITTDLSERRELFVPEGQQIVRATGALRDPAEGSDLVLLWDLPHGLDLDKPETVTGPWSYPPVAKFDRLLRHTAVPIGLVSNGSDVRLVYAPAGEATGTVTFRLADMLTTGGRPILDAFRMLLCANRLYGVPPERALPRILADSRRWQSTVSERLAGQVFEAATLLLEGFEDAGVRDGGAALNAAMLEGGDHVHRGVLTALLRVVFLLYAEDSSLMPAQHALYQNGLAVTGLYDDLRMDAGAYPDSMHSRFGAWGRLVSAFRAVFLGASHGDLLLPPRRGALFDPHRFPFLEGWAPAASAPVADPEARASVAVPTVPDGTVLAVLERLIMLDGQRISYRSLDVEQIGSVYESMLGFTVERLDALAVRLRGARRWVTIEELIAVPSARRSRWLKEELELTPSAAERTARVLHGATKVDAVLDGLRPQTANGPDGRPMVRRAGQLVIQPRRSIDTTTTHYTPRSLCRPLVARALEPVLAALGAEPSSAQLLSLKVCDPAMGSGAFLVEACRYLAEHLVAAWRREGRAGQPGADEDPLVAARRVIAQRCLYGVDRNADAVELAKLSLWLVTLARDLPFTFVDHALRHGDSLVGLDMEQLERFHWDGGEPDPVLRAEIQSAIADALPIRARLEELAAASTADAQAEKQRLLWDAEDAVQRLRTVGDLVVLAHFSAATKADREAARVRHRDAVLKWLRDEAPLPGDIVSALEAFRQTTPCFHWPVELPEIFHHGRVDPLESDTSAEGGMMDVFAGNMPFIGGRRIATVHGERYAEWLCDRYESTGEVDYATYFFLRANALLGSSGTIGLIATNAISQGDTRRIGLQRLLSDGLVIYDARTRVPWPGANVLVAPVLLAKGACCERARDITLNHAQVATINSRLRSYAERSDPRPLAGNEGAVFVGCFLRGEGFVLSPDEAASLRAEAPADAKVVRPYLVGEDIAKDPHQQASRFVIDFGVMSLDEARGYPRAMSIIEERVRPDRERLRATGADAAHRRDWWKFANTRVELRAWLAENTTCLVLPRVAKHLMIARVPCNQVFSEQVVVFALHSAEAFAVLQSRVHETWVRLLSSTMGEGLRYSASDCFDTFPFPLPDPRASLPAVAAAGERLERTRAAYMADEGVGLTTTYNRMRDPTCAEGRVTELRALHEEVDRAVVGAYAMGDPDGRWREVEVPPYCARSDGEETAREAFEDAVIDALFGLNGKRAEEEKMAGAGAKRAKGKKTLAAAGDGARTGKAQGKKSGAA